MFSVKLNVHEDKELREYIQQLIRGQVRSALKGIIEDEVRKLAEKKYGGSDGLEEMIRGMTSSALNKDTKLRKLIEKEAERHVKNEVARVFQSYREDYDMEPSKPRKLDLPTVTVSKGLKNV